MKMAEMVNFLKNMGTDRLAIDAGSDTEAVAPEPWTSMSVIASGRLLPNIRGYTDAP
jgi:hypothetical protein